MDHLALAGAGRIQLGPRVSAPPFVSLSCAPLCSCLVPIRYPAIGRTEIGLSPGPFFSQRAGYFRVLVSLRVFIVLVPLLVLDLASWPPSSDRNDLLDYVALGGILLSVLTDVLSFVSQAFVWPVWSNTNDHPGWTQHAVDDDRYCCLWWPVATDYCPNTVACAPPITNSGQLHPNVRFYADFYSTLVQIGLLALLGFAIWKYRESSSYARRLKEG